MNKILSEFPTENIPTVEPVVQKMTDAEVYKITDRTAALYGIHFETALVAITEMIGKVGIIILHRVHSR